MSGPNVLLIDDDHLCGELTLEALKHEYPEVQLHQLRGCEGSDVAMINESYDVLLLDLSLLGHDGLDCLKKVRERLPDLPVVILTGTGGEVRRKECDEAGADGYVLKNAMHLLLGISVHEAIEKRRSKRRAEVSARATGDYRDQREDQLNMIQKKLKTQAGNEGG